MKIGMVDSTIRNEEVRTIKWFLILFYFISIFYDIFYYYILPKYINHTSPGLPSNMGYIIYIILFCLIPVVYYLIKNERYHLIKYIYFLSYTFFAIIYDISIYWGTSLEYKSGNVAEIFLVLFSPIFVSNRFFWLVSVGTVIKYLIVGFIIQTSAVFVPIVIVLVLSVVAYILLNRFLGYVKAIGNSYDKQLQGIVKGVIATLELKDPYTRGHSERVAAYALSLAKEVGKFTKEELKTFNYACLLHDVGKIHIPDQILMKPGRLTNEEFEIIKSHPVVGAEAVESVEGLKSGISVIRSHHERWDGTGYPEQLTGEGIPLLARITTIADAFDAMTSSRSYRQALPLSEAYSRIIEGQGTQFDPAIVEVFKKVYPIWVEYHKSYPWEKGLIEGR